MVDPAPGSSHQLINAPTIFCGSRRSPQPNAAIAQMLWRSNSPDLFDTYCAGMVLLRMALPPIRTEKSFKGFWEDLTAAGSIPEWCVRKVYPLNFRRLPCACSSSSSGLMLRCFCSVLCGASQERAERGRDRGRRHPRRVQRGGEMLLERSHAEL